MIVRLEIDGLELNERTLRDFDGKTVYASNPANRGYEHWWVASIDVPEGTVVRLETMVGVNQKGRDTDRSTTHNFVVTEDADVVEVRVPKVGPRKYPLLKGRLRRLSQTTEQEKIDQTVESLFDEVEDENI